MTQPPHIDDGIADELVLQQASRIEQMTRAMDAVRPSAAMIEQMTRAMDAVRPSAAMIEQMRTLVETNLREEAASRGVSADELRAAISANVLIVWDQDVLEERQADLAWRLYELGELLSWAEMFRHIPPARRIGFEYAKEFAESYLGPLFSGILWGNKIPKNRLN